MRLGQGMESENLRKGKAEAGLEGMGTGTGLRASSDRGQSARREAVKRIHRVRFDRGRVERGGGSFSFRQLAGAGRQQKPCATQRSAARRHGTARRSRKEQHAGVGTHIHARAGSGCRQAAAGCCWGCVLLLLRPAPAVDGRSPNGRARSLQPCPRGIGVPRHTSDRPQPHPLSGLTI